MDNISKNINREILFLSCFPHWVHLEFAKSVGANIKIINFSKFFEKVKLHPSYGLIFPLLALITSLNIKIKERIIIVEGSGMLYLAAFLKLRNRKLKIIYLDADQTFSRMKVNHKIPLLFKFAINCIDGIISVSKKNLDSIHIYTNSPGVIVHPFPKEILNQKKKRSNYGLYIGRLDPEKEIKKMIRFALNCPYFEKFIIAGDGVLKDYVKQKSKENSKLIYLGHQNEVSKLYNKCKFFLHFCEYDSYPCTVMEASKGGCYPLISKKIGNSYLFNSDFIINNINDSSEINQKIKTILSNEKKYQKLLLNSNKYILSKQQAIEIFRKQFDKLIGLIP